MLKATAALAAEPFPTPDVRYTSIAVDVTQDPYCLPNAYTLPQHVEVLHFIAGTAPTTVCATPTSLQKVLVPSVVGFSQQDATSTLEGAGFYVRIAVASSTQPAGTVIYQTPGGGLAEFQTSTITVTISKPPKTAGG